ncbi:DUF4198 domain-containing protein [Roseococcus pinisoli]|uniref:DUF4198 domain-containing protein n=1 Tax=Roseococcus pinisoli TaxID=2835040 RepID=A0ABS5Q9Q1_9PROT|nr:DUF4198 domain-containing protein [Roseococcus pinisoli]MBS7810432.1 DUF4198 domain-containing protein [Roseococcus pinisoli]
MFKNGLPMLVMTALVTLASSALAHQLWLERDGDGARLYFGEPVDNLRERSGALLDRITGPRIFATDPAAALPVTRREDHIAATLPAGTGDIRMIEDTLAPFGRAGSPDRTRAVMLAREGRTETRGVLDLELVPVTANGNEFTLMFRGQPLPRTEVTLVAPPLWERKLRTDAEGRVTFETPWAGRYVAEAAHVDNQAGGTGEGAYTRQRFVSTLSFAVRDGIAWPAR